MRISTYAAFAAAVFAGAVFARPFELYQPIIDRCPFGDPPDDPSVPPELASKNGSGKDAQDEKELTKEQEQLEKAVRVSVLTVNPDGRVMVGFSDLSDAKKPVHYYMAAGETRGGWFVKEADAKEKKIVLVKDGQIEIERMLGENSSSASKAGGGEKAAAPARPKQNHLLSHKSRRRQREADEEAERLEREKQREQMRLAHEEAEKRRAEDKAEREAEREEMREQLSSLKAELQRNREAARQREAAEDAGNEEGGSGEND